MAKKNYVLDTNILLASPESIYGFDDNNVYITPMTLQELDSKKTASGELGYNAREVIRILDGLRVQGQLINGVSLSNGGTFYVANPLKNIDDEIRYENLFIPKDFDTKKPDNRIILSTIDIKKETRIKTILVTNDISMRVNASICGLEVEAYHNDQIKEDERYKGYREIDNVSPDIVNKLHKNRMISLSEIKEYLKAPIYYNEFLILKSWENNSALAVIIGDTVKLINTPDVLGITPMNVLQTFALYALTAPVEEVPLVILQGVAGTAKTFLSLAAGLSELFDEKYNQILITRNNVMSDADFGYLPGDIDEKMNPLLAPFTDNLRALLSSLYEPEEVEVEIAELKETKKINACPLSYIRGRSLTDSYLIVDEAQNSTRGLIRDIITRAGRNCKIVILGDPNQVDNHILDKYNNGLVFAANGFKSKITDNEIQDSLCMQLVFDEEYSVRSPLAAKALQNLANI